MSEQAKPAVVFDHVSKAFGMGNPFRWRTLTLLKRSVIVPIVVLAIADTLLLVIRSHWIAAESGAAMQKTDDAYVKADEVSLSTRITGTVRRIAVGDYQPVKAGQVLVEIDDTDYEAAVDGAKAALDGAKAEYAAIRMLSVQPTRALERQMPG